VKQNKVFVALPRYSHRNLLAYNRGVEARIVHAERTIHTVDTSATKRTPLYWTIVVALISVHAVTRLGDNGDTYTNWDMKEIHMSLDASTARLVFPSCHSSQSFRFSCPSQFSFTLSLFPRPGERIPVTCVRE